MASYTQTLIKARSTDKTITTNKWFANFSTVKKYALDNKLPLISIWSNGDACGHCIDFERILLTSTFKNWMKKSECVFWIGFGTDKNADDKFEGTGFTWARKNTLRAYPFVRVYWAPGKVDYVASGDTISGGSYKNYKKVVTKFETLLKNYDPCGGNCGETDVCTTGDCNVTLPELPTIEESVKTRIKAVKTDLDWIIQNTNNNTVKTAITDAKAKIDSIQL